MHKLVSSVQISEPSVVDHPEASKASTSILEYQHTSNAAFDSCKELHPIFTPISSVSSQGTRIKESEMHPLVKVQRVQL